MKRFVSVSLVLVMLLVAMPISAFAVTTGITE